MFSSKLFSNNSPYTLLYIEYKQRSTALFLHKQTHHTLHTNNFSQHTPMTFC